MNSYSLSPDFRLIRNLPNEVLFQVRDVDRKPVRLPDGDIVRIAITVDTTLLLLRDLSAVDVAKGVHQLLVGPNEMSTWPSGPLRWSIIQQRATATVMLWTDLSYTAAGTLYLTEAPLPGPTATRIDWSDFAPGETLQ